MNRFVVRSLGLAALTLSFALADSAFGQDKVIENIQKALPEKGPTEPKAKRKVLIYSKTAGFRHGSIPVGIKSFIMMGDKTGAYIAEATEDPAYFTPEKLKNFDAVIMLNTTGDCLRPAIAMAEPKPPKDKDDIDATKKFNVEHVKYTHLRADAQRNEEIYKNSLHEFVLSGKGLMGTHSATDTYAGWKAYNKMMGGSFSGHPWNAGDTVGIKIVEPKHPLNAAFKGQNFKIKDEIYQFRADTADPKERTYLLTLDPDNTNMKIGGRKDGLYPISWVASYGKGRTFYCSLGHNDAIYYNPTILQHYLAGLQYVLGDYDVPAIATPVESPAAK